MTGDKLMKRPFTAASYILLLLLVPATWAEELPSTSPEDVGMSSEKLARIKPAIQKLIDDQNVAGAITMVARRGKVVYFEAAGMRDIEAGKPMQRDTICRFFSMTKPVTSAAVMMLVEEGKVGLDDPVSKHVPELAGLKVIVKMNADGMETAQPRRDPTVRDLLRHTSGLTYGVFGITPVDQMYVKAQVLDPAKPLADMMKKLGEIPLLCEPGTKWNYSVSTDVLGRVVEVVAGRPLDEFFAERILRPLDMRDTGFYVPGEKLERFATTYGSKSGGGLRATDVPETSAFRSRPALLSGGGGLVSTARDYMRFCQMIAAGGQLNGQRLLEPETVRLMTTDQLPKEAFPIAFGPLERPGVGFGLGFAVQTGSDGESGRVSEYGWGGAASTHFWISPRDELVVIALQQFMPFTPRLEQTIKPLVYEAIAD
jgi:CubicO group peptidase (beta-lactamase class C family)